MLIYRGSFSILHVCGGDPIVVSWRTVWHQYSPRMWRSSQNWDWGDFDPQVFSTYVEVILNRPELLRESLSILHVCGGHPTITTLQNQVNEYSPRMWRSSYLEILRCIALCVFSTYVEVIPV